MIYSKYLSSESEMMTAQKNQQNGIPVTIVTGFLGSGKTTLLNRILSENHGKKIAVILNEIGDVNLDGDLVVETLGEDLKVMNNGCVCCTVRGDLTKISKELFRSKKEFDHLVIETTGMADPSPVAQTFFMDKELAALFHLDAVVTVVDCLHIDQNLKELHETQDQIGFADVILLNKVDLLSSPQAVKSVENEVRKINSVAKIFHTTKCAIDLNEILDIRAFDLDFRLELNPTLTTDYHSHEHDEEIKSIYIEETRPLDADKLDQFMSIIVNELGNQVLRYKGVIYVKDMENRLVFQGVHMTMGSNTDRPWRADEEKKTKMVFIGRHLPADVIKEGLSLCVAD